MPYASMVSRLNADASAPLYFFCAKTWSAVSGTSLPAIRALQIVFSTATIGAAYVTAGAALRRSSRSLDGANLASGKAFPFLAAGLTAATLVACSPLLLEATAPARMYGLAVLLTVISSGLALYAGLGPTKGPLAWMAYGASVGLLCLTHYFGVFLALAQATFFIVLVAADWREGERRWLLLRGAMLSVGTSAVVCSPWVIPLFGQSRDVLTDFWIESTSYEAASHLASQFFTGVSPPTGNVGLLMAALSMGLVGIAAATPWLSAPSPQTGINRKTVVFAALLLLPQAASPWIGAWVSEAVFQRPLFQERYFAMGQAAWLLFVAVAISQPASKWQRRALLTWFLAASAIGIVQLYQYKSRQSDPWKAVVGYLGENRRAGDLVLVGGPDEVNLAMCNADLAGVTGLRFAYRQYLGPHEGHYGHLAALDTSNVLTRFESATPACSRRVWVVARQGHDALPTAWQGMPISRTSLRMSDGEQLSVTLVEACVEPNDSARGSAGD